MNEVEHIFNTIPKVSMTAEERSRIRGAVSAHIEANLVADREPVLSPYSRFSKAFSYVSSVKLSRTHVFESLAVALLIVCGGISVAAQGALPGEPLYAVKVNINEELSGAFAFSPQAKAQHEASLAATRLDEAVDLSAEGKLTPQARATIEANLETHVDNVEKNVTKLTSQDDARGAIEVSSDLASTLHAHEQVMQNLAMGSDEAGSVASAIRLQLSGVSDQLNMLEKQVTNEVSSDSEEQARLKATQAESAIAGAKTSLVTEQGSVNADTSADANQRISTALGYLSQGYASMGTGAFNKAFINFQSAIRFSKEARVIIAAGKNLDMHDEEGNAAGETATSTATTTDEETSTSTASTTPGANEGSATGTSATSTATTTGGSASSTLDASDTETMASTAADMLIANKIAATSAADFSHSMRADIITNLIKSASDLGF